MSSYTQLIKSRVQLQVVSTDEKFEKHQQQLALTWAKKVLDNKYIPWLLAQYEKDPKSVRSASMDTVNHYLNKKGSKALKDLFNPKWTIHDAAKELEHAAQKLLKELPPAFQWLHDFTEASMSTIFLEDDSGNQVRDKLTQKIVEELAPYKLEKPVTLYRGLTWMDFGDYQGDMSAGHYGDVAYPKIGDPFDAASGKAASWTKGKAIAKTFATGKSFGIIVAATVKPDETLVDTDRIPEEYCFKLRLTCKEREVVTLPDAYIHGKIVYVHDRDRAKTKTG